MASFSQKNTVYILEIESRINTIIFWFVVVSLCRQDEYNTVSLLIQTEVQ